MSATTPADKGKDFISSVNSVAEKVAAILEAASKDIDRAMSGLRDTPQELAGITKLDQLVQAEQMVGRHLRLMKGEQLDPTGPQPVVMLEPAARPTP